MPATSTAWTKIGEGEIVNGRNGESHQARLDGRVATDDGTAHGKLKTLPGGRLGKQHAEFQFNAQDIRFTVGKNGNLYAFCMNVPEAGQTVTIHSVTTKPRRVSLLGYTGKLKWKQSADGLAITYPKNETGLKTVAVFRIEQSPIGL